MKLLLTSDLFDVGDGGALPRMFARMLRETGAAGRNVTAVWLRDGRAGWPDAAERFRLYDRPGLQRMSELGVARHVGLWINREDTPGARMVLEREVGGDASEADLAAVRSAIDEATVLFVAGGEPYKLLKQLRKRPGSQVWQHALARMRAGKLVYVSRSAGTIIAGSNVDISGFRSASTLDGAARYLGNPIDWAGLDLAPGNVALRPHYTPGGMLGAKLRSAGNRGNWSDDDLIENLRAEHPDVTPVRIRDGEFLYVSNGELQFGHTGAGAGCVHARSNCADIFV